MSKHPASSRSNNRILPERRCGLSNEATPVACCGRTQTAMATSIVAHRTVLPSLYTLGRLDRDANGTSHLAGVHCGTDSAGSTACGRNPAVLLLRVSRQELRAHGLPSKLQPLVELQYCDAYVPVKWFRLDCSRFPNCSRAGLDVVGDRRTEEVPLCSSMASRVGRQALKGRRLDADDFDKLSVEDPVRDMLRWLDNPQGFETAAKGSRWESFRALSSLNGIYPDQTSPAEIAALLLRSDPTLDRIWSRFSEAPQLSGSSETVVDPMSVGCGMLALDATRPANQRGGRRPRRVNWRR